MTDDPRPLILHVVFRFAIGGLENGVVNLLNRMPSETWRHSVVALTEVSDSFCERVKREDVRYTSIRKPPGHAFGLYPRLFRIFREQRPAIVHTRNLAALETVVPAWAAGVPVRIHGEHGREFSDLDGGKRRYQLARRLYRPFVHQYVALSNDLERYLIQRIGVPADRVEHIYNGVDCERFRPVLGARTRVEGSPFNDPSLFVVGTVGRLDPVKDQTNLAHAFVRALAISPAASRRLRLMLVGDGPLRSQLESIVRAANIESLVWFAGERSDVSEVMSGLDCFVLPSLAEGISNTILEAMASGLPVIATRVGANADLMEDGMSGRLVPRGNPQAIAQEILAYLSEPALARRHGHAGRQIVERRFSLDRMVSDYE
ncbi:MAG: TIGR03088 family PEP-CTERM/XrtA system glycosyltransferase, partial [Candidatus Binataceae bacterium]